MLVKLFYFSVLLLCFLATVTVNKDGYNILMKPSDRLKPKNEIKLTTGDDDDDDGGSDSDIMFTIMFTVCDCLLDGSMTVSANSTLTPCDMVTGQCVCLVPGITGLRCDSCLPATNCESLGVTDTISQLHKLCVKITIFMQGHVLIADWSVAILLPISLSS